MTGRDVHPTQKNMIIDAHTHAFPDFLAARAVAGLQDMAHEKVPAQYDGTVTGLLRSMDCCGVGRAVICSIATAPGQNENILNWSLQIRSERLIPLASVHPQTGDIEGLMARIASSGLKGIKIHPIYQACAADDPAWDPVYACARDLGLKIAFHAGYDIAYPTDSSASPRRIAAVLDRFPGLAVFAAHYGGWRAWDEVYGCLAGRGNVYLGTSFTFNYIDPGLFLRILDRHGPEKVMFGTDSPWLNQAEQIGYIKALGLGTETEQRIFCDNAVEFYGLSLAGKGEGVKVTKPGS